ncbi:MAG TPA: SAM-dependent methyltransferase, partial [Actinoplanes sp.]
MGETSGAGETETAPAGIDTSLPHSARMYDYWLGGKDNFAADRELGQAFAAAIPDIRTMARENRAFMRRAAAYLHAQGITQFLDIGTGIPTEPNVHDVAPGSRVVYVDNDPVVLVHARALMDRRGTGLTAYIDADLREPQRILADPLLSRSLDLDRPVGLLLIAVLMLIADEDDPAGAVRQLLDALPSGSYVAISHPGQDFDPEAMSRVVAAASQGGMTLVPRVRADVTKFFDGWDLVEPGVVAVDEWKPDGTGTAPGTAFYWAG